MGACLLHHKRCTLLTVLTKFPGSAKLGMLQLNFELCGYLNGRLTY
jgi:hypothetical protein